MGPKPSRWGTGKNAAPSSITQDDEVPSPPGDLTVPGKDTPLLDDTSGTESAFSEAAMEVRPGSRDEPVTSYTLTSADKAKAPRSWVLEASDDGEKWKPVDRRRDESFRWDRRPVCSRSTTRARTGTTDSCLRTVHPGRDRTDRLTATGPGRAAGVRFVSCPVLRHPDHAGPGGPHPPGPARSIIGRGGARCFQLWLNGAELFPVNSTGAGGGRTWGGGVLRPHFEAEDLLRVSTADEPSPLLQAALAFVMLRRGDPRAGVRRRQQHRHRLPLHVRPLDQLFSPGGAGPHFLHPPASASTTGWRRTSPREVDVTLAGGAWFSSRPCSGRDRRSSPATRTRPPS